MAFGRIGRTVIGALKRYRKRPVVRRATRRARRETKLWAGGAEAGVFGDKTARTKRRLGRSRPFASGYRSGRRARKVSVPFAGAASVSALKASVKAIRGLALRHPFTSGAAGGATGSYAVSKRKRRRR